MPKATDLAGLASAALALAAGISFLPGFGRLSRPARALVLLSIVALALWPIGPLPLGGYLRGVTGDLSIPSLLLMGRFLLRPFLHLGELRRRTRLAVESLGALGGLLLYPLVLSGGRIDPYALGYQDPFLLAALLGFCLLALFLGLPEIALGLSLAVGAYAVGFYESKNLWDYLLDPFMAAFCILGLLRRAGAAVFLRPG